MRNAYSEIMQDYAYKYRILKNPQSIRNLKQANSDLSRGKAKTRCILEHTKSHHRSVANKQSNSAHSKRILQNIL